MTRKNREESTQHFQLTKKAVILRNKIAKYTQLELANFFTEKFGFNVPRKTISNILRNEEKILMKTDLGGAIKQGKEMYQDLEKALVLWIQGAAQKNLIVNEHIIVSKAKSFAKNFNVDTNFKFSHGWLQNFKKRHGLKQITLHGEAESISQEKVVAAKDALLEKLKNYSSSCIYNMDETGLFLEITT